jgi:2-polyprenyl-3-methyl-5-hydroxy-6-metoxy-1,4-benzoquinol methylase
MIAQATAKASSAGQQISFQIMDAAQPHFAPQQFDAIVCRHVLWALPQPEQVLERWVSLLTPGGQLVLIEGFWHTGAGLHAQDVVAALPPSTTNIVVQKLSNNSKLWGAEINDERYAIIADKLVTATA